MAESDKSIVEVGTSTDKDSNTVNDSAAPRGVSDPEGMSDMVVTNVTTAVNSTYVYIYTENEINYEDYTFALVDTQTKKLVPIFDTIGGIGSVAAAMIRTKIGVTATSLWELVISRGSTEIQRHAVVVVPNDRLPVVVESVVMRSDNASSSRIATVGDTVTFRATFSKPISGISFRPDTEGENFSQAILGTEYQAAFKISSSSVEGRLSFDLYNIAGFSGEQAVNKNGSSIRIIHETTDGSQVEVFGTGNGAPDNAEADGYIPKNEYSRLSLKDSSDYNEQTSNLDIGCGAECQAFFQGWIDGYEEFDRQCGVAWEGKCVKYENFFDACTEQYWAVDFSFLDECTTTADCNQKWRTYFTSCKANWKGDYRNYLTL